MNLIILFAIPLLGSLLLFVLKGLSENMARTISVGIASMAFGVTAYLFFSDSIPSISYTWIAAFDIKFSFKLDGLSKIMVLLTNMVTVLVLLSTAKSSEKDKTNNFYALILLAQAALLGVFMAQDIFLFYFLFEVALVPVYFLALYWGNLEAPKATFKMFIYTIIGSLFMLVALVFLYSKGQTSDISQLMETAKLMPLNTQRYLFWAFLVAFAIKMPIFPFHSWQPDAYTSSGNTGTMLLSGLLSKMGVYGLIRILLPLAPLGMIEYANVAIIISIIGLLYGSFIAIQQDNIKRLVAFSSFAHMGLMAAGVFVNNSAGLQGSIFQMLAHGINAVGLFYVVDIIYQKTGTLSLASLGGISQKAPKLVVLFMIALLGSVALPLTNGFIGEFLLLKGVFDYNAILGIIAAVTIILGAVYMLRLMQRSMFGATNELTENITDIGNQEMMVLVPIAILVIVLGVYPNLILDITLDQFITLKP